MPLEVRELVVSVSIEQDIQSTQPIQQDTRLDRPPQIEDIIAECVERVLETLRERRER